MYIFGKSSILLNTCKNASRGLLWLWLLLLLLFLLRCYLIVSTCSVLAYWFVCVCTVKPGVPLSLRTLSSCFVAVQALLSCVLRFLYYFLFVSDRDYSLTLFLALFSPNLRTLTMTRTTPIVWSSVTFQTYIIAGSNSFPFSLL